MAEIGKRERAIEVLPLEDPVSRELPVEAPQPAPREPSPILDTAPA